MKLQEINQNSYEKKFNRQNKNKSTSLLDEIDISYHKLEKIFYFYELDKKYNKTFEEWKLGYDLYKNYYASENIYNIPKIGIIRYLYLSRYWNFLSWSIPFLLNFLLALKSIENWGEITFQLIFWFLFWSVLLLVFFLDLWKRFFWYYRNVYTKYNEFSNTLTVLWIIIVYFLIFIIY